MKEVVYTLLLVGCGWGAYLLTAALVFHLKRGGKTTKLKFPKGNP